MSQIIRRYAALDANGNLPANVLHRTGTLASLLALTGNAGEISVATDTTLPTLVVGGVSGGTAYVASLGEKFVLLDTDFTTTSLTLVNITNFSLDITANSKWIVRFHLNVGSSDASGMRMGASMPAGATGTCGFVGQIAANAGSGWVDDGSFATGTNSMATRVSASMAEEVEFVIRNGSTAGTVQFKLLSVAGGTETLFTNSSMHARRIA